MQNGRNNIIINQATELLRLLNGFHPSYLQQLDYEAAFMALMILGKKRKRKRKRKANISISCHVLILLRCPALPSVVTTSFTFDCIDVILCRADIVESGILLELQGILIGIVRIYTTLLRLYLRYVLSVGVCVSSYFQIPYGEMRKVLQ